MQADLAQRENASAEDLKQSLRQIGRSSIRATHTVNQLLALARAESSGAVLSHLPCDFAKLTMDVVRDCVPRAMDKQIDLGYEGTQPGSDGVMMLGNQTLLKEMVRNLVDNAINYTPSTADKPGPAAERELVFQPFYRALGNEVDGSGLGLPIVLEIAGQHHATVTVDDSRPGQPSPGACFTVRFPRSVAPDESTA